MGYFRMSALRGLLLITPFLLACGDRASTSTSTMVATAQLKETGLSPRAWVYMIGWNNPQKAAYNPDEEGDAGMNENCAGYRYQTSDQKWVGTVFAWEGINFFGAANERGLKFYSGSPVAECNRTYPIACCE